MVAELQSCHSSPTACTWLTNWPTLLSRERLQSTIFYRWDQFRHGDADGATHNHHDPGIHVVMVLGAIMPGGGFAAASFASQIWHLYLSQGALVGIGVGFAYVPTVAILSQWFEEKRSLASGIAATGSGGWRCAVLVHNTVW